MPPDVLRNILTSPTTSRGNCAFTWPDETMNSGRASEFTYRQTSPSCVGTGTSLVDSVEELRLAPVIEMSPPGATPGPWSAEFITAWMDGGPETASKLEGRMVTPDVESCAIAFRFESTASVRTNGRMVSPIWPTGGVVRACT